MTAPAGWVSGERLTKLYVCDRCAAAIPAWDDGDLLWRHEQYHDSIDDMIYGT